MPYDDALLSHAFAARAVPERHVIYQIFFGGCFQPKRITGKVRRMASCANGMRMVADAEAAPLFCVGLTCDKAAI